MDLISRELFSLLFQCIFNVFVSLSKAAWKNRSKSSVSQERNFFFLNVVLFLLFVCFVLVLFQHQCFSDVLARKKI